MCESISWKLSEVHSPNDAIEKRRDDKVKFLKKVYDGYVQKVLSESDDDNALLINS